MSDYIPGCDIVTNSSSNTYLVGKKNPSGLPTIRLQAKMNDCRTQALCSRAREEYSNLKELI